MKIYLKAGSYFKKYTPGGSSEAEIPVREGSTIGDLLNDLGISPQTPILLCVNGTSKPRSYILKDFDKLTLFPFMDGG